MVFSERGRRFKLYPEEKCVWCMMYLVNKSSVSGDDIVKFSAWKQAMAKARLLLSEHRGSGDVKRLKVVSKKPYQAP